MKLMDWHRIGQLVVCIDATPVANRRFDKLREKDILDIAKVHVAPNGNVYLGFSQHPWPDGDFMCWSAEKFRPVMKTDISCLRSLIEPLPTKQKIGAH